MALIGFQLFKYKEEYQIGPFQEGPMKTHPLLAATYNNNYSAVKALLEAGIGSLNYQDRRAGGLTPLCVAAQKGLTPLCVAAQNGNGGIVSLLLQAGADPNKGTSNGFTPLMFCAIENHEDVVGYCFISQKQSEIKQT